MAKMTDEVAGTSGSAPTSHAMEDIPIDDRVPPAAGADAIGTEKKGAIGKVKQSFNKAMVELSHNAENGYKRQTPVLADPEKGPTAAERMTYVSNEVLHTVNNYMNKSYPVAKDLSTPEPQVKVGTWNVRSCIGQSITANCQIDVDRCAKLVKNQKLDIVGLQEIEHSTSRYRGKMHVDLMEKSGLYDSAFLKTMDRFGGEYGIGVISRYPIKEKKGILYGQYPGKEVRGALAVRVQPPQFKTDVWFVTTHLQNDLNGIEQEVQCNDLAVFVESLSPQSSVIVTGDFNAPPVYKSIHTFKNRGWQDIFFNHGGLLDLGLTHPAILPVARLDYIFVSKQTDWKVNKPWVVKTKASDHRPVCALLQM